MNNKKSRKTPAQTPASMRVPSHGNGLLRIGGSNGGAGGRPPNKFKDWCEGLLDDPATRSQVEAIMQDKDHPAFRAMFTALADRAYGKAVQSVAVSGGMKLEDLLSASRAL